MFSELSFAVNPLELIHSACIPIAYRIFSTASPLLSNPDDAAALSDADYQRKVAYTIYNGIMTYLTSKPDAEDNDIHKNENSDILQEATSSV